MLQMDGEEPELLLLIRICLKDFKKRYRFTLNVSVIQRLPNDNTPATSRQVQSWKSIGSQYTREEKIIRNAEVLSLKQINALQQVLVLLFTNLSFS